MFIVAQVEEFLLCIGEPILQCLLGVTRERGFLNDELVKVVPQEVSTGRSPMPVINPEKGTSRPLFALGSVRGSQDIQDYGHSVLIVVPHESLIGVGCIGSNHTIALQRVLGRLMIWDYYLVCWL